MLLRLALIVAPVFCKGVSKSEAALKLARERSRAKGEAERRTGSDA